MQSPFDSPASLRAAFVRGLEELLRDDGLGAYILVLANASLDPRLRAALREPLRERFEVHAGRCRRLLGQGATPDEAADDLLVFLKLMALGFDALGSTETRQAGAWEMQFNLLRSFRPTRMSGSVDGGIQRPFDAAGFHFNKAFLRKETFWSGPLHGHRADLLYNKFPFVDLHGLLVPDRQLCLPQFLTRRYHEYAWRLATELGGRIPGMGIGYNSFGANASVNHLHLQMFVRQRPLPLLRPQWRHNGGDQAYPAVCRVFDQPEQAWGYLDSLHQEERPYNLVYLPGRVYCLPRARQGSFSSAAWSSGFGWYEMSGGLVAFNRADYAQLAPDDIAQALRQVGERVREA